MKSSVKVFAPASVSNVGCGFDTIGFAIFGLGDEISVKPNNRKELRIKKITGDHAELPKDAKSNTATVAIAALLKALNTKQGFDIEIKKKMPLCSGLGSSAASAVAGVFAVNEILGKPFKRKELLPFALAGEFIASKAIHADNVAPSLFGGFILIRDYNPTDIIKIKAPKSLHTVILHSEVEINTAESRKLISKKISLKDARAHFGNVGALISGLYTSDFKLIGKAINDKIAEPVRGKMIPAYYEIKKAALDAGAYGCNISGSGPSIFAFGKSEKNSAQIGKAMKKELNKLNIKSQLYVSKINNDGPLVIG